MQSVQLGRDYDSLQLLVTARPHERDPSSRKCTMLNPLANLNLRHGTGVAALSRNAAELATAEQGPAAEAQAADAVPAGAVQRDAGEQVEPTGGHVTVQVSASGITKGTPALEITVVGRDLHAPLIERVIELPMDIHSGRVTRQHNRVGVACVRATAAHAGHSMLLAYPQRHRRLLSFRLMDT